MAQTFALVARRDTDRRAQGAALMRLEPRSDGLANCRERSEIIFTVAKASFFNSLPFRLPFVFKFVKLTANCLCRVDRIKFKFRRFRFASIIISFILAHMSSWVASIKMKSGICASLLPKIRALSSAPSVFDKL